jgi:hypothetical protein
MSELNIKINHGEAHLISNLISRAIAEEKKRLELVLEMTNQKLHEFERKYGFSTVVFLEKFQKGEIPEDDTVFSWWAESKIANELQKNLKALEELEICQK